ncbi:MAG: DUF2510 domain-containing protein [Solirubrobacteraceae bacterium]|nr:DUF2510 domain-containing protein [Solirubrobacteraceae bacterium]
MVLTAREHEYWDGRALVFYSIGFAVSIALCLLWLASSLRLFSRSASARAVLLGGIAAGAALAAAPLSAGYYTGDDAAGIVQMVTSALAFVAAMVATVGLLAARPTAARPSPAYLAPAPSAQPRREQGWYSDPSDPSGLRWWDGLSWTEHTRPA